MCTSVFAYWCVDVQLVCMPVDRSLSVYVLCVVCVQLLFVHACFVCACNLEFDCHAYTRKQCYGTM